MKVKVAESILLASAHVFRSKLKITPLDEMPLAQRKTTLEAINESIFGDCFGLILA